MEKSLYSKELESIKKSNRFRTRELFDDDLVDLVILPTWTDIVDKQSILDVIKFVE